MIIIMKLTRGKLVIMCELMLVRSDKLNHSTFNEFSVYRVNSSNGIRRAEYHGAENLYVRIYVYRA